MNILKHISITLFVLIFSLNLSASDVVVASPLPNCSAQFSDTADINNSLLIHFTDLSIGNITNWNWNFGDGSTSYNQNPSHTYAQAGNYLVSLIILDSNNFCSDSISKTINVSQSSSPCQADFSFNASSSNNLAFLFIDQSQGNPYLWQWDFGDGSSSNIQAPNHTYAQAGTYTVKLIITTQSCVDSISKQVVVSPNPNTSSLLVYVYADSNYLVNGKIYLYHFDIATGNFQVYDSTLSTTNQGITYYNFPNIPTGYYYVYAKVLNTSSFYTSHYTTWMPNTIYSQFADSILVNSNTIYTTIQLAKSTVLYPNGNGGINGNVSSKSPSGNTPLANIDVYLLLNDSNIITKTTTNQQGSYSFDNLAFGTYYIHPEIIGKSTQNRKVTIDFENPIEDSASFVVDGSQIIAGIEKDIDLSPLINIYPNPAKNNLFIASSFSKITEVNIEILDVQGRIISNETSIIYPNSIKTVNTSKLSHGLYIIKIQDSNRVVNKKFIKQ